MELLFIARPGDKGRIESLLYNCGMPSEETDIAAPGFYALCEVWGSLVGVVGIEIRGNKGVLRSLAISPAFRRRGFAQKLVAYAEKKAEDLGVGTLYLLTTSAAEFFAGQGYAVIPKTSAPQAMMAAMETGQVDAARGQYMSKALQVPAPA